MKLTKRIKDGALQIAKVVGKNAPVVLAGCAVVGVAATAVLAFRAGRKSEKAIRETEDNGEIIRKNKDGDEVKVESDVFDRLRVSWKFLIPVAIVMGGTIITIVAGTKIANSRLGNTIIAASGAQVLAAARKKKGDANGNETEDTKKTVVLASECDEAWFVDDFSGRTFKSTMMDIQEAVNDVNRNYWENRYDGPIELNEFYAVLGLKRVPAGSLHHICVHGPLEVDYEVEMINGKPHIILEYYVE